MNVNDIVDLINRIEDKFPVNDWEVEGVKVWPIIRMKLRSSVSSKIRNTCIKQKVQVKVKKIFINLYEIIIGLLNELRIYILDYKNNDTMNRNADVVFVINSPKIKIDNMWFDKSYAYIKELQTLNMSAILIQTDPESYFHIPRKFRSVLFKKYIMYAKVKSLLLFYLYKFNIYNINYQFKYFNDFIKYIKYNNLSNKINKDEILKNILEILEISNIFKNKLRKIKPFICFQVCYYGTKGMALNLACRKLNIASVDIQHGVQGYYHSAYGRWNNVPKDGYELLPRYFWCWSEREVRAINDWSMNIKNRHKAYEGGNLWSNMWGNGNDFKIKNEYSKAISSEINYYTIKILYTLQTGIEIDNFILEAINISPKDWKWFIRLHPTMLSKKEEVRKIFSDQFDSKVELDLATNSPLEYLLSIIDVHITSSSSTVIDAYNYNVPSIVMSENAKYYYYELIKNGWIIRASNCNEIIKSIYVQYKKRNNILKNKKCCKEERIDSTNRMKEFVNMVIKEKYENI